ncbi:TniB family NTP-binding protein [Variovorax sp. J22G73]|nr:TniB family NTP-binding protein [Variovorax sp. J22G73]
MQLLNAPDEIRIHHIYKTSFFEPARVKAILKEMEDLMTRPKVYRPPNLLIIGATDSGKTELLQKFRRMNPASARPDGDAIHVPTFYLQAPPGPFEEILLNKALLQLGIIPRSNMTSAAKIPLLVDALEKVETRVLMIDEIHQMLAGPSKKTSFMMNLIKYISNESQISLVLAGTAAARQALSTDDELIARFSERPLPAWKNDDKYKKLLACFEATLPLRFASDLHRPEVAALIYGESEQQIGGTATIIRECAARAVRSKVEAVTEDILKTWIAEKRTREVECKSIE